MSGSPPASRSPAADRDAAPAFAVGQVLDGRFVIEGELGRGGMGVVYAARSVATNEPVALKVMAERSMVDDEAVARFLRESRVAATLKSPHVARVLDAGRLANGAPYLVMERLRGASLAQILRSEGALDAGRAADFIAQACDALGEAHALAVFHRDVKLENLFLSTDGVTPMVKVLDFGLATRGEVVADALVTKPNTMMGTPRYMSPEHIDSPKEVDARADIWALGVCLYLLVTAKFPFEATNFDVLCVRILTAKLTKPSTLRPDLPPMLEDIILRCLNRNRAHRYADARELGEALRTFAQRSRFEEEPGSFAGTPTEQSSSSFSPPTLERARTLLTGAGPSADSDLQPRVGAVLASKYRVETVLGAGGMGTVFAVTHLQLGELYALKCLLPTLASNPDVVARFLWEAQASARMKSEQIARVSDVGRLQDGTPYLVMEHLTGEDLAKHLRARGPLPIDEGVDIVLQACAAIHEAHGLGIVHRDLKPSNLFLTKRADGSLLVKVLDFGISKSTADTQAPALTTTRDMIGSPAYMSPEQIRSSRNVDFRADIWALGVILHEVLTGALPFEGTTASALLAAAAADEPRSARAQRPDVPTELDAIVRRCLEKRPDARFQSVAELALVLEPFGTGLSSSLVHRFALGPTSSSRARVFSPAASSPALGSVVPPGRARLAAWVVPLVLVLGLAVGGLALLRRPRSDASARATASPAVPTAPVATSAAVEHGTAEVSVPPPAASASTSPPPPTVPALATKPHASAQRRKLRPPEPSPSGVAADDPTATSH